MSKALRREKTSVSSTDEELASSRCHENELHSKATFPPNIEGMTSLKVDNITQRTGVNLLKKVFSKFGDLGDVYVPRYPDTFASRGFAFVRFIRKKDAEEAMRKMNGYVLDGRVLSIQMARYARPSPSKHLSSRRNSFNRNSASRNGSSRHISYKRSRTSYHRSPMSRRRKSHSRSHSRERHDRSGRNTSHKERRSRSRSDTRSNSRSRSRSRDSNKRHNSRGQKRSRTRSESENDKKRVVDDDNSPKQCAYVF